MEYIKFTERELDLLSIMLEDESGKAHTSCKYATSSENDYGYKDELKSIWKKVIKGVPFQYKLQSKYIIKTNGKKISTSSIK
jgi:hypothetical protein